MGLFYLNLLSNLSFTFSLLSFAFIIISNITLNEFIFLILFLLSSLVLYLRGNRKLFLLSFLLFLIPIFLSYSIFDKILLLIFSLYVFHLLYKDLKEVKYGNFIDFFKKSLPIVFFILFISIFFRYSPEKSLNIEKFVLPYLFIYFVSSVFLLRILRYLEYNPLEKRIVIINMRYSIGIILLSIILSISYIRNAIFTLVLGSFDFLVNMFIVAFGVIFIIIGYILQKFIYFLIPFLTSKGIIKINPQRFESLDLSKIKNIFRFLMGQGKSSWSILDTILIIGFSVFVISMAILIIFWLIKREGISYKREEIYKEEKEFIFNNKNFYQRIISMIKRRRDFNIIREYYRKYLLESKRRGVEILPSHTTLDIYEKTKNIFDPKILSQLREIYIFVRYNIKNPSSQLVKDFLSLYKKMMEGKN